MMRRWMLNLGSHAQNALPFARCGALAILLGCLGLAGCEVAGVVGDAAGSVVGAAQSLANAGKQNSFANVSWDHIIAAARRAANDLALTYIKEEIHPEQRKLVFQDDRKQEVVITAIRRTSTVTQVRVDVGLFGENGLARLTMKKIVENIPVEAPTTAPGTTQPATTRFTTTFDRP